MVVENRKYEYHLHFWGECQNDDWIKKQGVEEDNFWFETREELDQKRAELRQIAEDGGKVIAFSANEGFHVRERTIAHIIFAYNGKRYSLDYDFGYGYSAEAAEYMFFKGNYSCDCNKGLFLSRKYDDFKEYAEVDHEMPCGDEIEIVSFELEGGR